MACHQQIARTTAAWFASYSLKVGQTHSTPAYPHGLLPTPGASPGTATLSSPERYRSKQPLLADRIASVRSVSGPQTPIGEAADRNRLRLPFGEPVSPIGSFLSGRYRDHTHRPERRPIGKCHWCRSGKRHHRPEHTCLRPVWECTDRNL